MQNGEWVLATAEYGGEFVAAVQRGNVCATQFHPEKSGGAGLDVLRGFLEPEDAAEAAAPSSNGAAGLRA
jgi:glutamine amidotransferase/cyclase